MKRFLLVLKGLAMGIAEVIPGVSGGTIAFITGIYERLLKAIRSLDFTLIGHLARGRFRSVWMHLDGPFLFFLLLGMALGIGTGVFGVSHLLERYPEVVYAFFFGLILASAWYIGRGVKSWNLKTTTAILIGALIAFVITRFSPAEGLTHPVYIVLSGFLAISALMLPGISGSFILLLLGMYTIVIGAVRDMLTGDLSHWWIIVCFVFGMVLGLILFSRVLTWMFRRFHEATLALLAGFMIGSLGKIWPWRLPVRWMDADGTIGTTGSPGTDARVLTERAVMPGDYTITDPQTGLVIGALLVGIALIILAAILERRLVPQKQPVK